MPELDVAAPAEPSSASDTAIASKDFSAYSRLENARESGQPLPADSAPAKEETSATEESVETAAVPEPASTQEKPQPKKGSAEHRIRELLARVKELESTAPSPREPAKAIETVKATDGKPEAPKRPKLEDFDTYGAYETAHDEYVEALTDYKTQAALAGYTEAQTKAALEKQAADERAKADQTLNERFESAKAAHDDWSEIALNAETPISEVMDAVIRDSEHAGELLYQLGLNGSAEGKRIAGLSATAQAREMFRLEQAFGTPEKPPPPATPKKTAAPKPPTDLAGRNTEPADEAEAAIAARDVDRYIRVMNSRDARK